MLHNVSGKQVKIDLSDLELSFTRINASIGRGDAVLQGTTLLLDGQTSVVLR